MQGPQPDSDREYIIQIYDRLNDLAVDVKAIRVEYCSELKTHDGRIGILERWQERVNGGVRLSAIVGGVLAGIGAAIGIVKGLWQ